MTDMQTAIMTIIDRDCTRTSGVATAWVASCVGRQPGRDSNRKHSAFVLSELCGLEAIGRVRRMDDEMPIVWCKGG
jgi:hypothetical protein